MFLTDTNQVNFGLQIIIIYTLFWKMSLLQEFLSFLCQSLSLSATVKVIPFLSYHLTLLFNNLFQTINSTWKTRFHKQREKNTQEKQVSYYLMTWQIVYKVGQCFSLYLPPFSPHRFVS